MSENKKKKKVLIVGWDAADWKIINPLLDSGQMPALERLVNNGVIGNIATLDPPLSPMLWTSIATGKTADKHGILNFVEPHPEKLEVRPVTTTSRKVKAFWNILNQEGYKCNVVGWWPSNPAEPLNGAMVSNLYQKAGGKYEEPWEMAPGTVHPEAYSDILRELRIHPGELTLNHYLPFIPNLREIVQDKDRKDKLPETLGSLIADCSTIHSAATWLMENTEWDVMAVYYDAIDMTCHHFMRYHPPQLPGVPDNYFNHYKDVVSGMYRFHDMMLERLLDLAGEDTTVILLSDHGFHSDHLRPKRLPQEPDAPALEHRPFGVFCIKGPGIKKDDRAYGATLLDITPTLLTLLGLPVGRDMDGKVLSSIFEKETVPQYIDSWETVPGDSGMHPGELQEDPIAAQEALRQLVELGYIEAPGPDKEKNIKDVVALCNFNLSRVYTSTDRHELALPLLKDLYTGYPQVPRYGFAYASCLQRLRKTDECRAVIESLRQEGKREFPQLDLIEATLLLSERKPHMALDRLKNAEKNISHMPGLYQKLGSVYNSIQRWNDAINAFTHALEIDHENHVALQGRGIAWLRLNEYEKAIEDLLDAIGLLYHLPHAHYFLGVALFNYGEYEKAAQAFQVCIGMEPGYRRAYAWLVKIYTEKINDAQKAARYREIMETKIKGAAVIVSGLPRSGTSMMMQMLKAGGLEIMTDHERAEDRNNPKGYYEYEPVKKLAVDNSWVSQADGKVLKVVTQLLTFLPATLNYKVIYMERDLAEVLKSQQVMLGKSTTDMNVSLAQAFDKQSEKARTWLKAQPHVDHIYVSYAEAVNNPKETAERISAFLGQDLDIDAMTAAVDGSLYRNRAQAIK